MTEESKIDLLANNLRDRVMRAEFGTSGRLPAVSSLAKEWHASRATVYTALQLLQSEGLLIAKDNSFVVNYPIMRIPGITPTFDKYLVEHGQEPKMENIIDPEVIAMPADIAKMFKQQEGVHVVHRMRRQGTVDVPYRLAENWYPATLAQQFVEHMRQDSNLDVLSEIKRVHGLYITDVHEDVIARLPTTDEARLLAVVRTTPVLEVRRSNFSSDVTPIMFNKIILVGAYFELSYDYHPLHWKP